MNSVDMESLRQTMRLWASGVTVVTSTDGITRAGVTASSFTSVSLEPPLVLVCLQNYIETYKVIQKTGHFAISILNNTQANLSAQFAGFVKLPEGADRFHQVETHTAITGSPILKEAVGWMDCRLHAIHEAGVTRMIIGEVVATGSDPQQQPIIYHNRAYYNLTAQS